MFVIFVSYAVQIVNIGGNCRSSYGVSESQVSGAINGFHSPSSAMEDDRQTAGK